MKTKKVITITTLLVAFILFANVNSFAQYGKGQGKGMCMKENTCCGIPDLTDEQETKIENLKTAHMKEMLPLKNQMGEKRAQLKTLTTADKVDMAAVNKKIDEIGSLKVEMMKKKEAHRQDVRALLNDNQRLYFDMHKGKGYGHKGGKRGHGMQHGRGQGYNRGE